MPSRPSEPITPDEGRLADLARFARLELDTRDVEPWADLLAALHDGGTLDLEQALWLSTLYNTYDDLASAWSVYERWPTLTDWACDPDGDAVTEFNCTQERRNLRGGRVLRRFDSFASVVAGDDLLPWMTRPLVGDDPAADFVRLTQHMRQVWGVGRQAAFEWAEFAGKVAGLPVDCGDAQLWESEGPRRSLQRLYGNPTPTRGWLDARLVDLVEYLTDAGVTIRLVDLETVICDFNVMVDGRYYVGRHLAALREELDAIGSPDLDAAWLSFVPAPWVDIAPGINPDLMPVYRDTGTIIDAPVDAPPPRPLVEVLADDAPTRTDLAREVSSFMQRYAKTFAAGAFATPTGKELDEHPERLDVWRNTGGRLDAAAWSRTLDRPSHRTHFTGDRFTIPAGARLVSHVARNLDAPPPVIDADWLMTYAEDHALTDALLAQGYVRYGTRITTASEVIAVWCDHPLAAPTYDPVDVMTVAEVPLPPFDLDALRAECAAVTGWADDFPYYSDGTWGAVCLKGFWPDDPGRGVKPTEMPKTWKAEHPDDLARTCEWTVLGETMRATRRLVDAFAPNTERVRLLRMAGTGNGALGRHTDIGDRATGTRDGQIARFHIPLVTHPDVHLLWWELDGTAHRGHLRESACVYLDTRKPHAVDNPTNVDRVHLVIDAVMDDRLRTVLRAAARNG